MVDFRTGQPNLAGK